MKKILLLLTAIVFIGGINQSVLAQESSVTSDTWYVWIDTEVPIDSKMVKIVSKAPITITCCPKSAKYRKFVKKTAKWISENIAKEYNGELSLMKIQDQDLANQTIAQLKELEGVIIVDYIATCK
jgi:hypothetical protein